MKDLLTTRKVARALEVSESSIKRWCDKGLIATRHTAGGHRRIALRDLVNFLRASNTQLVHPEIIGLPATSGRTSWVLDRAREQLTEALLAGEEARCRQIAVDLYLAEHNLSVICDEVFTRAFQSIGECWADGTAEIYQERRGAGIAMRVLHELSTLLPPPPRDAPLAFGGAPHGDQYTLGTTMSELVLRDVGWNAVSMGNNLPFSTLAAAIRAQRPQLFWLSCSYLDDHAEFIEGYQNFHDEFSMEVAIVVGGFALSEEIRQQMKFSAYCDNMQHLEGFAQTLSGAIEHKTS